tara:strand:+ start:266 stop:520 length:255 start_codon:yes stop_codon:yes gene_type:complete
MHLRRSFSGKKEADRRFCSVSSLEIGWNEHGLVKRRYGCGRGVRRTLALACICVSGSGGYIVAGQLGMDTDLSGKENRFLDWRS